MKGAEHVKNNDQALGRGLGTRPYQVNSTYDSTSKIQDL